MKEKAATLADKMNKLTEKFTETLDIADDLDVTGDDVIEVVNTEIMECENSDLLSMTEIINLQNMVEDFKFVRETLKENAENGRRVLTSITLELLESGDTQASLITSFAELNKAVADNMKLYINAYKEISIVLVNLDKIKNPKNEPKVINNTLNVNAEEPISTSDLIKQLS